MNRLKEIEETMNANSGRIHGLCNAKDTLQEIINALVEDNRRLQKEQLDILQAEFDRV